MDLIIDSHILELAPVFVVSPNNIIEKWNKGLSQIYGWSQSEALGRDAHQLLMTVFPQPLDEIEQQILVKGEWEGELVQTKKGGSLIVVTSHWILQRDETGQVFAILEFIHDITDHKKVEDALKASEYKYKCLIDDSPSAVFQTTLGGKAIFVNPAFARMFGYQSPNECLALIQNSADLSVDPIHFSKMIGMVRESPGLAKFESLYRRKDDSTFWGNLNVRQVINEGLPPHVEGFIEDITERKQAEDALHASEEKYRLLIENIGEGISLTDPEDQFTFANSSAGVIFGVPPGMLPGRNLREFIIPEQFAMIREQQTRKRQDGNQSVYEIDIKRPDGERRNLLVTAVPQFDSQGEFAGTFGIFRDITESKYAEKLLQETVQFNLAIIDSLPASICVLNEYGTIISYNHVWREFAAANGATDPDGYLGVNYLAVCDAAQGEGSEVAMAFAEGIRKVMRHDIKQFSLEYACNSPGENRWFIGNVTCINGINRKQLVITHINITERKQTEQSLAQLNELYLDLFENSGTNIIVIDEDGKCIMINKKAAGSFGKSPEEIVGKSVFEFLPLETANKYLDLGRQILKTDGHREYIDTFSLPVGERTFLIVDQRIQIEGGKKLAIQSSSVDITDQEKINKELQKSRARLSHLSYRLVISQELERRRIARELHDEIGQNLTGLMISLAEIQKSNLGLPLNDKLMNAMRLAQGLTNQITTLSADLRPMVLDDLGLVHGLVSLINRMTIQTGMEIDFKHGPLEQTQIPAEIEMTAYRIIQEALTNVIRYANVKLATVRVQIDGDTLWIQIQDDGKGFDYQTTMNNSHRMGLTSMQERAEQVGGLFSIETAQNEGTNITCRLPLFEKFIQRRKNVRD